MRQLIAIYFLCLPLLVNADITGKVLFVDSYHEGYAWSDGVRDGFFKVMSAQAPNVQTKAVFLDSKRQPQPLIIQQHVVNVKQEIMSFQPDVLVACDDNAMKHLVMPYFKDAELPIVFCGLNWDASIYGLPYNNVTGMVEVSLIPELIDVIKNYNAGERIAVIIEDRLTSHKNIEYHQKLFDIQYTSVHFINEA